ncbi:MAG: 4-hydroxy-3-methylbut-2-enyl diphosphate reductase [Elusimicrobia bacterium]|nr:4-hydroxy-3-methylbut-2-enyl diphosphate reductase [Elusimicrobiota bacterium]
MPSIIVAKNAGFCPGVKNAIDKVLELRQKYKRTIYTLGPLIHNKQVIQKLEEKNIFAVERASEIKDKNSILVIRAHGIPPYLEEQIKKFGVEVIDATCPLVKNVHNIIRKYSEQGYATIIVGDRDHAEVIGLVGYAQEKCYVVSGPGEAKNLPEFKKANVVAQTTQEEEIFFKTVEILKTKTRELVISNTICNPTKQRQRETLEFSKNSDLAVIVGGKNSANTRRLFQICSGLAKTAVHIEKADELEPETLRNAESIFITAGASTPSWMIDEVVNAAKEISKSVKHPFMKKLAVLWEFAVASCIYTALAAICLTYVCMKLEGAIVSVAALFVSGTFVLSLHLINRTLEKGAVQPDKLKKILFIKFKSKIKFAGISAGILSIAASAFLGYQVFFMTMLFWLLGTLYPQRMPFGLDKVTGFPASKDIVTALGWGFVCAYVPGFLNGSIFIKSTQLVIMFTTLLVFMRSVMFGISSAHNDMIVGKENFYKAAGPNITYAALLVGFVMLEILLMAIKTAGFRPEPAGSAFLGLFYYAVLILAFSSGRIPEKTLSETVIDSQFVLLGILAYFVRKG